MASTTDDAERGNVLQGESPFYAQPAIDHQELFEDLSGLHAASMINKTETKFLIPSIKCASFIPAQQCSRSSNDCEEPLFTDGQHCARSDPFLGYQLGFCIIVFTFPYGQRGFDMHMLTVILKALDTSSFIYMELENADHCQVKSTYIPISGAVRRTRSLHKHIYVRDPEQSNSILVWLASVSEEVSSSHDGPFDTRTPSVAARTSRYVEMAQTKDQSTIYESNSRNEAWDPHDMLALGDSIRTTIRKGLPLDSHALKRLKEALNFYFQADISGNLVSFEHIVFTKFDKVVAAIINSELSPPKDLVLLDDVLSSAKKAYASWRNCYAERLFLIESERAAQLTSSLGRLAFVVLIKKPARDGNPIWIATRRVPGAGSGVRQFKLGDWFLNMACVFRDGLSHSQHGTKRLKPNEVVTLPLLNGIETIESNSPIIYYSYEGNREEMLVHLQDKVGKELRILRGHQLKSPWAPKAGIRYDGWYYLSSYSIKRLADGRKKYWLKLKYTRRTGQPAIEDYADEVLKPSMLDDWETYKKIMNRKFMASTSPAIYALWRCAMESEEKERREWQQNLKITPENGLAEFA